MAKTIDLPFKDRGVFEQSGVQDIFAGLQQHALKLSNDNTTHAKSVDNTLVKSAKSLSSEIKDFVKRLEKDGVKGGKTVTKNQTDTQKHIDLLGTHLSKGKGGGVHKAAEDPFVTHRGVLSRLDGQVQEENAHHSTLINLQNECAQFESKIVKSIQDMISQMGSQASSQAQSLVNSHQQLTNDTTAVSSSAEWNAFVARDRTLANPNASKRTAKSITFAGSDHELTQSILEGDLLRKGTVIKKYNSAYYVLTPSGFLHEFKSKSFETDPEPAWSLDLKTAAIGSHSAKSSGKAKWTISGKTKGLISSKHDFQFQATTYEDMLQWWTAIKKFTASSPNVEESAADDSDSEPTSPIPQSSPTHAAVDQQRVSTIDERAIGTFDGTSTTTAAAAAATRAEPVSSTAYDSVPATESTYGGATSGHVDSTADHYLSGSVPSAAHGAA